jgi:hypothetical protein
MTTIDEGRDGSRRAALHFPHPSGEASSLARRAVVNASHRRRTELGALLLVAALAGCSSKSSDSSSNSAPDASTNAPDASTDAPDASSDDFPDQTDPSVRAACDCLCGPAGACSSTCDDFGGGRSNICAGGDSATFSCKNCGQAQCDVPAEMVADFYMMECGVFCDSNSDCTNDKNGTACLKGSVCGCTSSADCRLSGVNTCTEDNRCVFKCQTSEQCKANVPGTAACDASGDCVGCLQDSDCGGDFPVCVDNFCTCTAQKGCENSSFGRVCLEGGFQCGCNADADCPDSFFNACEANYCLHRCTSDADCTDSRLDTKACDGAYCY